MLLSQDNKEVSKMCTAGIVECVISSLATAHMHIYKAGFMLCFGGEGLQELKSWVQPLGNIHIAQWSMLGTQF